MGNDMRHASTRVLFWKVHIVFHACIVDLPTYVVLSPHLPLPLAVS